MTPGTQYTLVEKACGETGQHDTIGAVQKRLRVGESVANRRRCEWDAAQVDVVERARVVERKRWAEPRDKPGKRLVKWVM